MHKHPSVCRSPRSCRCKDQGPAVRGFMIPCLLFLLKDAPSHGYQLLDRLQESGYLKEIPDPGVIYRHLRKLEREEMVTSEFEPGDGPARKVYTLTPMGRSHMDTWIRELKLLNRRLDRFLTDTDL